jgi:hypothetical protein
MDWREYQIKEFELRIKLIEVIGKWNVDMAAAEKARAEAENLAIKNTILKRIDNQLKLALAELNRHKRIAEDQRAEADRRLQDVNRIKTGQKPLNAPQLGRVWASLDWFLNFVPASDVGGLYGAKLRPEAKVAGNFVAVSNKPATDAPDEIQNLGQLIDWTRQLWLWFKKASPAHLFLLQSFSPIESGQAARVKELDDRLRASTQQSYDEMSELRTFLGLPESVQKTLAQPNP